MGRRRGSFTGLFRNRCSSYREGVRYACALSCLVLLLEGACNGAPAREGASFPLGPGPEFHIGVPGANTDPSLKVQGSSVVLTWKLATGRSDARWRATSHDLGRTFSRAIREDSEGADTPSADGAEPSIVAALDSPTATHVKTVRDESNTVLAIWDEESGAGRRVVMRRLLPGPHSILSSMPPVVLSGSARSWNPVIAALRGGAIAAWVSGDAPRATIAVRRVGLATMCVDAPAGPDRPSTGHVHQ
jgi:hypothetical protein